MVTKREIVARKCYEICQRVLPRYNSRMESKKYEFWQLIAMFLHGIVYNVVHGFKRVL